MVVAYIFAEEFIVSGFPDFLDITEWKSENLERVIWKFQPSDLAVWE